ncbi:MAG: YbdK family carboxylate-amine ligase [Burkholderiaceae bacterium]|nr:YbdK family carboxylate-amine ligase [Burkholderiaceae bacterium]
MQTEELAFRASEPLTMGVELELPLVDRRTGDLTRGASDLIALVERRPFPGDIKPEITESMIEISTAVHRDFGALCAQLQRMRDTLVAAADRLDLRIAGGGANPFQRWHERQIFDRPRFRHVAGLYGYLAKQFTVFGQHVHIGCPNGTVAMRLLHALARYVPQFIALAACSPYYQGADTAFDCSRLNTVFAFPLSGRAPFVTDWPAFERYFGKMRALRVVESMKDFYWDIRPKPEYGTIEVRVFDTPLTVERAAELAAYTQAVCAWLLETDAAPASEDVYLTYSYNRFQACRFGLEGQLIDAASGEIVPLHQDVLATLARVRPYAERLGASAALQAIEAVVRVHGNHARRQRETFQRTRQLADVVMDGAALWAGQTA